MNPFEFYKLSSDDEVIPISKSSDVLANADIAFSDDEERNIKLRTRYPIPVLPDFISARVAAQNGVFTIHGTEAQPIEKIIPLEKRGILIKFVANPKFVAQIVLSIEMVRPSHHNVFPDIEGIKAYIV